MRVFFCLLLAAAPAYVVPSHADDGRRADVVRVEICGIVHRPVLDGSGSAQPATCEPLPVAFDLRFLDDDYTSEFYGLPVALDLDWESGEP